MVMMPVIAAQTKQLLPIHTHGIRYAAIRQNVQLTVNGGQPDLHSLVFEPAMQILRGYEFIARFERIMNQLFLLGVSFHPSVRQCNSFSVP